MLKSMPTFVARYCDRVLRSGSNLNEPAPRIAAIAAVLLLAGCEGEVTMDLASEPPADLATQDVVANLRGLEFRKSGGDTETLEFVDSEQVDFMEFAGDTGTALRLFTDEELPEGDYTGVRLLFDTDDADTAFVTDSAGNEFPLLITEGDYASLSFSVDEDDSSSESFTLTLDLRQSLSFDDTDDDYTLTPILRSVISDEASRIEGVASATCPAGSALSRGAVYLFEGSDITPDDRDGTGVEPYATAPVTTGQNGQFIYALRFLPAGNYTLALTCLGDEEDPAVNDDLEFRSISNIQLDDNETLTVDIT